MWRNLFNFVKNFRKIYFFINNLLIHILHDIHANILLYNFKKYLLHKIYCIAMHEIISPAFRLLPLCLSDRSTWYSKSMHWHFHRRICCHFWKSLRKSQVFFCSPKNWKPWTTDLKIYGPWKYTVLEDIRSLKIFLKFEYRIFSQTVYLTPNDRIFSAYRPYIFKVLGPYIFADRIIYAKRTTFFAKRPYIFSFETVYFHSVQCILLVTHFGDRFHVGDIKYVNDNLHRRENIRGSSSQYYII